MLQVTARGSIRMCDDLYMCMLGALLTLVMLAAVPLTLYWLWIAVPG